MVFFMADWPKVFEDDKLLQIAMPMGGLGAGCICINGYGGLQDFSIRNAPATTATPENWDLTDSAFGLIHIKGGVPVTRLLEGPLPRELIYAQGTQTQGYRKGGQEGLPRFAKSVFKGQFPFGLVDLTDPKLPVKVEIEGWSPFIPLDDKHSGIPAAILNYTFENVSAEAVDFEFSYHICHFARAGEGERLTRNRVIPGRGVFMYNDLEPQEVKFGSGALAVVGHEPTIKAAWFRGGWFDSISALWREVSTGTFSANDGTHCDRGMEGRNGGSVMVPLRLAPGERVTVPVVIAWHFPNVGFSTDGFALEKDVRSWSPYYSTLWQDARAVANEVVDHYDALLARTRAFRDALYATSIPPAAMDAIASNLAILKSPTVLRQASGAMWAWEGCFPGAGCCPGSCTHVWNYAQAICHLFPNVERTLREQELLFAMNDLGHVNFRASVPDGPATHEFHAAADGQLGGILKLFRDWRISGDDDWLRKLYGHARRSLDYGIKTWDPEEIGAVIEPHHNTYDIEFWGADGMCTTVYLGALSAMAAMARHLGKDADAERYEGIAAKAAGYLDEKLFNGEYYIQNVQWEGLRDTSFAVKVRTMRDDPDRTEMDELLLAEGPKYQYGNGCIADGVIGACMATIYGVDTPIDQDHVRRHLQALYRYNFIRDLNEHACLQRPGYALGHEAGLILCSWPKGDKPTLPFVYSDEVWTGIEYQVAGHMIALGMVDEGLEIVAGARSRYDGFTRNPYNEYECGGYYARATASFGLLNALSGFRYSPLDRVLHLAPKRPGGVSPSEERYFFVAATGFGTIRVTDGAVKVELVEGNLPVDRIEMGAVE